MRPISRATRLAAAAAFALALAAPADGRCTNYPDWDHVECVTPAAVRVELGDRDDHFGLGSDFPAGMPLEVYGGDGKDDISGYGVANGS